MQPREPTPSLSKISTLVSLLRVLHTGPPDAAAAAQQLLCNRYQGAIYNYLLTLLRDPHTAADLTQKFAISLISKEFHRFDPTEGRFRNYVKAVLKHLVCKHYEEQKKGFRPTSPDSPRLEQIEAPVELPDADWNRACRQGLLDYAFQALQKARPDYFAILRCRVENPDLPDQEVAELVGRQLGQTFTDAGFRQKLHRARELFGDLLLDLVAQSLEPGTIDQIEQELCDLDLMEYCRPALERYKSTRQPE